jgi:hypothetical protein
LHVTDTGDLVPIFSKAQSINAGAGDVLLAFKGIAGSGFEQCEPTTQTLTRGSQYQTSFLPEMNKDQLYTVRVEARYKDYLPVNFDLQVKYYPNLDGKMKFVDLGTHVFYKKVDARPQSPYKFTLANVLDDGVDDDNDDYVFELNNGRGKDYYELDGQENIIEIPSKDSKSVPEVGENEVTIQSADKNFQDSTREFLTLPAQVTNVDIPLVSHLKDGELAVVLTWFEGSNIQGTKVEMQNLDLHVEFQPQDDVLCTVDHAMRQCNGVKLTADSLSTDDRVTQVQAAKFDYIGDFNYLIYASRNKYNMTNTNTVNTRQLIATLRIYSPRHDEAIFTVELPFYDGAVKEKYWIGFCLRGG